MTGDNHWCSGNGGIMHGPDVSIRSAIFYPHSGVRTLDMLKTGLLLWDEIQFIAPDEHLQPQAPWDVWPEDPMIVGQAIELLLKRHVPTDDEKERTHETVEMLINSDLGDRLAGEGAANAYLIYPQKFSEKTWRLLRRASWHKSNSKTLTLTTGRRMFLALS